MSLADKDEAPKNVEINPMKAAVQNLVLDEFEMHIEFAVAIGEEFIAILKTRSDLSASVKDWSTKVSQWNERWKWLCFVTFDVVLFQCEHIKDAVLQATWGEIVLLKTSIFQNH